MKKVLKLIGMFLAIAVMSFGIFIGVVIIGRKGQEDTYVSAMEQYRAAINADEPNIDEISKLADEVYSDGYYGVVESAAKIYLRDALVPFFSAQQTRQKDLFKNGITKELIEKEQPEFEESLAVIAEMREEALLVKTAANQLFIKEIAMGYLPDGEELPEQYMQLYDDQVYEIYEDQQMQSDYLVFATYMEQQCDAYEAVINFLKDNNGSWHLEGDTVAFKTTALTNQYNQLLEKIK